MRFSNSFCSPVAGLLAAVAAATLSACSPGVSDIDLSSAKSRAAAKAGEVSKAESDLKSLNAEIKTLTGFTGAEHETRLKRVEELKEEKEKIGSLKSEIEGRAAGFEEKTKKVRESHAAAKH